MVDEKLPAAPHLVAVFAAVVFCFVGATAFSQYRTFAISRLAGDIADRTAPAIEHLAAGRAELRRFESLTGDQLRDAPTADRDLLVEAWRRTIEELAAFDELPIAGPEQQQRRRFDKDLLVLRSAVDHFFEALDGQQPADAAQVAGEMLRPAVRAAERTALTLVNFHADESRTRAMEIQRIRSSGLATAFVLDAVAAALAALAVMLLIRSLRRQAGLVEAQHRIIRDKAEELEQFSARLAHDIVGPIAAASMALELAGRVHQEQERLTLLSRARRNLAGAVQISHGLLDFARSGARPDGKGQAKVSVAVVGIVEEVHMPAALKGVRFQVSDVPECTVACDAGILTTLISNLTQNAIKYVGSVSDPVVTLRVIDRGDRVRFEVADNGLGLPAGLETSVFQPYVRAPGNQQAGIGLGLATVKRIAIAHGGAVGVESLPGLGCTFWFELPKAAAS